ncbi:MAG: hypothetical protein GWP05_04250 [Anaerolineaceae bacterium]|nr:hypothetical protein [Anaerolineaceae bacterium]
MQVVELRLSIMDDHHELNQPNRRPPATPLIRPVRPPLAVLAVGPADHPVAHAVVNALGRAGCEVTESADLYQAVVMIARDPARFAAVTLPVDYFNRQELRLFPMAARRWPALKTIALARPAFAYKAAVADLAGAHLVCTDADRAHEVLALLGVRPEAPATAKPLAQPPPPPTVQRRPIAKPVAPPGPPLEVLTEEEITALMADMDESDEQPLPRNGTLDE